MSSVGSSIKIRKGTGKLMSMIGKYNNGGGGEPWDRNF
jgi:hypothetical protein